MAIVLILVGLVLLAAGGDALVRGAVGITQRLVCEEPKTNGDLSSPSNRPAATLKLLA